MPIDTAFIQNRGVSIAKVDAPVALVVDDHPVNRKLMSTQLGLLGVRAECVEDGEVALAKWQDHPFALVITDCHMPKMDGYELTRAIRTIEASEMRSRTPIFAWTANALDGERERCHIAGMDELLVKPVGLIQLKEVLSKWLVGVASVQLAHNVHQVSSNTEVVPLDLRVLEELSNNAADNAGILQDFMSQTRSDLAELEVAVNMQDIPVAMRIAHRMKGASKMIGAHMMADQCEAMEHAARQGNLGNVGFIKVAMKQLEAYLADMARTNQEETDLA